MIRKTFLAGLLVLCGLLLGVPWLIGLYVAHHFDGYVARIDTPGVISVIGTRFQRGWFQSRAQITVQLADRLCSEPPCATLTLDSTIYHGPLPFTAPDTVTDDAFSPAWAVVDSRLLLAPLWPRLVFEPALKPLHVVSRISLSGQVRIRAWLPAARFNVKRETVLAHVNMARILATLKTTLGQGSLTFTLAWPLLRINGAKRGHFELRGLRARLETGPYRRRIVEQHLRIKSLTLDNGKGLSARLEGIDWQGRAVPGDADGMATQFTIRIERLVVNAGEYGPLVARGRIKGVNLALWRKLRSQFIAGQDAEGPDTSAIRALYNLYIPPILASGPVIDIRHLSLATPAGKLSGELHIAVPDRLAALQSLSSLLAHSRVAFRGRVPAAILRRVIAQIATALDVLKGKVTSEAIDRAIKALVQSDLIQPLAGGKAYRVHVSIDHGTIRINGRTEKDWATWLKAHGQSTKLEQPSSRQLHQRGKIRGSHKSEAVPETSGGHGR